MPPDLLCPCWLFVTSSSHFQLLFWLLNVFLYNLDFFPAPPVKCSLSRMHCISLLTSVSLRDTVLLSSLHSDFFLGIEYPVLITTTKKYLLLATFLDASLNSNEIQGTYWKISAIPLWFVCLCNFSLLVHCCAVFVVVLGFLFCSVFVSFKINWERVLVLAI